MGKDKTKKKKQKITYIDDGSTISDMSGVGKRSAPQRYSGAPRATFGEMFKTYTDAVKMMFLPMLAVLGIIALAFLLVYIIL